MGGVGGRGRGGGSGVQRLVWLVGGQEPDNQNERGGCALGREVRPRSQATKTGGVRGPETGLAGGRPRPKRAGRIRPDSFESLKKENLAVGMGGGQGSRDWSGW